MLKRAKPMKHLPPTSVDGPRVVPTRRARNHIDSLGSFPFATSPYLFRISSYLFQISSYLFRTSPYPFRISSYPFQTSPCPFQISSYFFQTSSCPFRISSFPFQISPYSFGKSPYSCLKRDSWRRKWARKRVFDGFGVIFKGRPTGSASPPATGLATATAGWGSAWLRHSGIPDGDVFMSSLVLDKRESRKYRRIHGRIRTARSG